MPLLPAILHTTYVLVAVGEQDQRLALALGGDEVLDRRGRLARRHEDALLRAAAGGVNLLGANNHLYELLHELALRPGADDARAALVGEHAAAVLLVLVELAYVHVPVRVRLLAHLAAVVLLEDAHERGARRPRVAPETVEQGVLELAHELVVGDEGHGASALHMPRVELAGVDGAVASRQGPLAAHLAELPLAAVRVGLVGPFEGAFAVVEAVEELANVAGLDGPLEHAMALEHVVLEGALVAADTVIIVPAKHALTMHHLILELADVAAPVGPLEDAVLEDAVVLQGTSVDAAVRPLLRAFAGGTVVFEDTGDHRAVGEAVAAWTDDLTIVPQALELGAVRPVEGAMTLKLTVVELALEPGAIREDLLALALDAVVLELAIVARAIRPRELALPLADAILPLPIVLDPIGPPDASDAVHAILQPVTAVDPALLRALEGAFALLHAVLEHAGVAVAVGPCPGALAVEDALLELANVLLP
mmetsp:Transcript_59247/g.152475  ORF Transcript_59247/g.152475 Transcript_59247/m.152475 type:complete len:480 (-) Transcript_59247:552-1991(-)